MRGRLTQWKASGALAIKFTTAYYRALDFAPVAELDAQRIYERFAQDGNAQLRDYRTRDYRTLQDFLFRHVAREAGLAGLAVHVHTGAGAGPVFGTAGSNPLLLEAVLNDFSLSKTTFVLVHGGFPFDREMTTLIQKSNVYTDISGMSFFQSRHDLSATFAPVAVGVSRKSALWNRRIHEHGASRLGGDDLVGKQVRPRGSGASLD